MNEQNPFRPKARLPRGLRDRGPAELAAERRMLDTIRAVYESYGFQALETPALEYADALGKFLPDQDRPNEGVFSFMDDDAQWMSLRYDLTAPLARYVAENFQNLPKPFRRYQMGQVWRNEKPGPGRFREFIQFDADTVGSASPSADAELLMVLADTYEALGLKRGEVTIKLNSRKLLDGVLEVANVEPAKRGTVLRAIDKLDRLGVRGVEALLGAGRKDESGDFTKGAELKPDAIAKVLAFVTAEQIQDQEKAVDNLAQTLSASAVAREGLEDLRSILQNVARCGYGPDRVRLDTGIVRGLDYYTGPVFEAQLSFPVTNDAGETVVFGSVGSGGRYDDLVARFTGQRVPASGVSVGVSRLFSAIRSRSTEANPAEALVVVLVLDKTAAAESLALAQALRAAGLRAEAYVGEAGMKAQLKYADKRGAAVAVIEGSDERARGEVTLKDLALGAELAKSTAKSIDTRADWVGERKAQVTVPRSRLVEEVRAILTRRG